ncbi:hypothetical protein Hanom_Chr16g01449591 [Helianthus anomalus]
MHASKSSLGNDIAKSYIASFAQEYSDMHILQSIQEIHIHKPFYKKVLTGKNGLRKAYVLYRFFQTSVFFRNKHTHKF